MVTCHKPGTTSTKSHQRLAEQMLVKSTVSSASSPQSETDCHVVTQANSDQLTPVPESCTSRRSESNLLASATMFRQGR